MESPTEKENKANKSQKIKPTTTSSAAASAAVEGTTIGSTKQKSNADDFMGDASKPRRNARHVSRRRLRWTRMTMKMGVSQRSVVV